MAALTKSDFTEIRKIIREEVENEVQDAKSDLQSELSDVRMRLTTEIWGVRDRVKNLAIKVTSNHKELKEEIKQVSDFLDKENLKAVKRVKRIEDHLGLSPPNQN